MLYRFYGAVLILFFGINFVAYSVWSTGQGVRTNPIWPFLKAFTQFEMFFLKLGLAGGAIVLIVKGFVCLLETPGTTENPNESSERPKRPIEAPRRSAEPTFSVPSDKMKTHPSPPPTPPTLSAEELKKKAIEQIIRGF